MTFNLEQALALHQPVYVPRDWNQPRAQVCSTCRSAVWPCATYTALTAAEPEDMSEISDGSHTFGELYEFRMLYNAAAVRAWDQRYGHWVVKSWRHSDGELCFGGGWFVVVAYLPGVGQVSNHYPAKDWDLFVCPEADNAPLYDGHTTQDVADRLRHYLTGGNS